MPIFDDATNERLFGAEDAENEDPERFKQYFYFNKVYKNLTIDLPIRILVGHKGIGKSALLRRAFLDDEENAKLSVWLRPNDLKSNVESNAGVKFNILIEQWKSGLLSAIYDKAIDRLGADDHDGRPTQYVRQGVRYLQDAIRGVIEKSQPHTTSRLIRDIAEGFRNNRIATVYIDDIDRGWDASKESITNISALLNAIRDLSGSDNRLRFRIGLRTDVYYLVRTSDESTDKIERHVMWLSWTNHEILSVMAKRVLTFFGDNRDQNDISKLTQTDVSRNILSKIMTPYFEGHGHWSNRPIHNVLLSLTRRRPRDLVKLLHAAARNAYKYDNEIINPRNLTSIFEQYSSERLQDTINEFKTELPEIDRLLLDMRPTKRERRTSASYLFTKDRLIMKMKQIMSHTALRFTNRTLVTPQTLVQFLYKIDFITARKDNNHGRIDRKYFDESRLLANEFVDFGYDWEIHPAYRWALQPHDASHILDLLDGNTKNR